MASAAMADPNAVAFEIAKRLSITTATLYTYVNGDGALKKAGERLLSVEYSINTYLSVYLRMILPDTLYRQQFQGLVQFLKMLLQ